MTTKRGSKSFPEPDGGRRIAGFSVSNYGPATLTGSSQMARHRAGQDDTNERPSRHKYTHDHTKYYVP